MTYISTNYAICLLLTSVLLSCRTLPNEPKEILYQGEMLVTVDQVSKAKRTKVYGHLFYHGIQIKIDNGDTGYYHKEYNLTPGQIIRTKVAIYEQTASYGTTITTSDLDIHIYEKL